MKRWLLAGSLALACAGPARAQEGSAIVQMADGSTLLFSGWTLVYEYQAARSGTPLLQAPLATREARELILGKKSYPLAGATLAISYAPARRQREAGGEPVEVQLPAAVTLQAGDGARQQPKLEPPARERLLEPGVKPQQFLARVLELRGTTATGNQRQLCLLAFTALVECPSEAERRVVRIEFQ
ncbi:MAG: hypothetical protein AB7O37_16105 [Vicinamibacteria bacterium]